MGVLEMEVMKFVAYCGGVTVKFRVDDLQYGAVDSVTWGLASTRACPALFSGPPQPSTSEPASPGKADSAALRGKAPAGAPVKPGTSPSSSSSNGPSSGGSSAKPGPAAGIQLENLSRKPLHTICSTTTLRSVQLGDILTIDLAPREDKQPVIMATLKINDVVALQSSLPCNIISSLQMYPYISVLSGMSVSLHEAVTPSPLFTWFHASGSTVAEAAFAELDTCVKYLTSNNALAAALHNGCGTSVDFVGSANFQAGRHRWTVQLDNYSSNPTHIFVGVVSSGVELPIAGSNNHILANVQGPLKSIAGTSSAAAAASTSAAASSSSSPAAPAAAASVPGSFFMVPASGHKPVASKWGAWIKLPGGLDWMC